MIFLELGIQIQQPIAVLAWPDWIVVFISGLFILSVGIYCSRQQTDLNEYFTASGNMGSFVVGISLYATLLSTISYLATPGEIIKHGPAILYLQFSLPIVFLIIGYIIIPSIMKYQVTSAYEILEVELGKSVRTLGALMFVCLRLTWMGLILYLSAKALSVLLGWDESAIPWLVVVVGTLSIAYTAIGGLRAVILTDVFQFVALLLGAILTICIISWKLGGISAWWPDEWVSTWNKPKFFSLDPRERLSVVGAVILGSQWYICTAGSDQTVIQRYMAVKDAAAARKSFLINAIATVVVTGTLALIGLALLGLHTSMPELMPEGWTLEENADELFPNFIGEHLPVGIAGLVMVGLFAAGMSSVDSGVNAVASVMMSDLFSQKAKDQNPTENQLLGRARALVWTIGIIVVAAGLLVEYVPGNFLEVSQKVTNLFVAPLFGMFFMALYVSWSNEFGTLVGAMYGLGTALLVGFWDVITGQQALGFQWIGLYSLIVQIVIGCVVCKFHLAKNSSMAFPLLISSIPLVAVYLAAISGIFS